MNLVGVDGCKYGWIAISLHDDCALIFKNLQEMVNFYDEKTIFLIDMPIGLPSLGIDRKCEVLARKELATKRKSSVFPVPCRAAVYAENYEKAGKINRDVLGKGLSKQTWFICSKIKELDQLLLQNVKLQLRFRESHPELAFHFLNDRVSMQFNKKTKEGQEERLKLLSQFSQNVEKVYNNSIKKFMRKDVAKDDVIDALCLAVTLRQILKNNISLEMADFDEKNLRIKIHIFQT